jgi:trimeric autotransporter adhesin
MYLLVMMLVKILTTGKQLTTALGTKAGTDAVRNITTGSNNIVLGNNASATAHIKIDWTVTSDLRDKINIENVPYGLDFVNQITPIKYNFKKSRENATSHGKKRFGFKAQEILALEGDNPVLIDNDDEDNLKITGAYLVPVLVNAIKELKAEIELLKNK